MPVRTCVGCRQRAAASDLLRVVAVEGRLSPDPRHRMPGRGAHVHPDPACLDLAERRRAFPRALRLPGPLDATAVAAEVGRRASDHHAGEQAGGKPSTASIRKQGEPR
ncbi:MAG TPA: YlxR family protein [Mycobacteriales bacterium]|jgi:predicted RNA-binding protein YlxR (DUF448 family)|nr:YlxR family protein [Mycobacteriales bacterium]